MPFGWLVFLVAILCALLPTLGNPGIRESPPSPPPPEEPEEEEVLGLREIATLALKSIPTAMRNRYDYRDPTISNDQLATYLQRFMDKNGGRLPDGRELPHKQSWAVAVWDAMGDDDERLQQLGFTGPSQGLVLDSVCSADDPPFNPCATHGGTLAQLNVPVEDPGRSADPEILESTTLKSFALMWSREGLLHDRASERAVFNLALRGCFHSIRVQAILPLDLNLAADCLERFYARTTLAQVRRGILVLPRAHSGVASPEGALWEARKWSKYGALHQRGPVITIIVLIIPERHRAD